MAAKVAVAVTIACGGGPSPFTVSFPDQPDVLVEPTIEDLRLGRDRALEAAVSGSLR